MDIIFIDCTSDTSLAKNAYHSTSSRQIFKMISTHISSDMKYLFIRYTSGQKFDQIPGFHNHVRVPSFPSGFNRHASFY